MLLPTAIQKFLLSLEADDRTKRTIETYNERLEIFQQFIYDTQGPKYKIKEIIPDDLDSWVVSMRRQGLRWATHPTKPTQNGGLSKATIAGRVGDVKRFFNWCVNRGHLERSPADHLKRGKTSGSAKDKLMDHDDLMSMVAVAEKRAQLGRPRDLAIIQFVAETGARRGEVSSLRIPCLDLGKYEALVIGKTEKGDEEPRFVEFGKKTAQALRDLLAVRPTVDHDFVFVSQSRNPRYRYKPLGVSGVYLVFKRLAKAADIKGRFNPHALRHLVGQHFVDNTNLELARKKLGHKHLSTMIMFYAHQDRERVKKATHQHSLLNQTDSD